MDESMRVRVIEVEGTPEEIANSTVVRQLLESVEPDEQAGTAARPTRNRSALGGLPGPILDALESRGAAGDSREAAESFLKGVLEWGDVEARIGRSHKTDDGLATMIRLHRRGSPFGAFVYLGVRNARLRFRLPRSEDLGGYVFAKSRNVQSDDPYGIALHLTTKQAVSEALRLARISYDRTPLQESEILPQT